MNVHNVDVAGFGPCVPHECKLLRLAGRAPTPMDDDNCYWRTRILICDAPIGRATTGSRSSVPPPSVRPAALVRPPRRLLPCGRRRGYLHLLPGFEISPDCCYCTDRSPFSFLLQALSFAWRSEKPLCLLSFPGDSVFLHCLSLWDLEPWKTKVVQCFCGVCLQHFPPALPHGKNLDYSLGNFLWIRRTLCPQPSSLPVRGDQSHRRIIVVVTCRTNINSGPRWCHLRGQLICAKTSTTRAEPEERALTFCRLVALRGLPMSPWFLHVMATSMTGIGLVISLSFKNDGWRLASSRSVCAMLIHLTWNGSAASILAIPCNGVIYTRLTGAPAAGEQRASNERKSCGLIPLRAALDGFFMMMATEARAWPPSWSTRRWARQTRAMRSFRQNVVSLP